MEDMVLILRFVVRCLSFWWCMVNGLSTQVINQPSILIMIALSLHYISLVASNGRRESRYRKPQAQNMDVVGVYTHGGNNKAAVVRQAIVVPPLMSESKYR